MPVIIVLLTDINEFKLDFSHSIFLAHHHSGFILGTGSFHRHASSQLDKFGARRVLRELPPEVRNYFAQVAGWRSVSPGNANWSREKEDGVRQTPALL